MATKIGIFAILIAIVAIYFFSSDKCSISEGQAKEKVLTEILRNGFDPAFLQAPMRRGRGAECAYDFLYKDKNHEVSYVVADDWQHGPELNIWDYAVDKNGP